MREHSNGMYSAWTYYLAKVVSEIPFLILIPMILSVVAYYMVGLSTVDPTRFWVFALAMIVLTFAAHSFGLMIGTGFKNSAAAVSMTPLILTPMLLFAGFFVNMENVTPVLAWLQYLSFFKYGLEVFSVNEFQDLVLVCRDDELVGPICPITSGDQVIASMGYDPDAVWTDLGILAGMCLAAHVLAFCFLFMQTRGRKERGI